MDMTQEAREARAKARAEYIAEIERRIAAIIETVQRGHTVSAAIAIVIARRDESLT